jgi:hypothetical protein
MGAPAADSLDSDGKSVYALRCHACEFFYKKRNRASRTHICSVDLIFVKHCH